MSSEKSYSAKEKELVNLARRGEISQARLDLEAELAAQQEAINKYKQKKALGASALRRR